MKIKEYLIYTTRQGDTWDLIAFLFLHEERKATTLIDLNPKYSDVIVFEAGVKLTIPVFEENISKDTQAPWRQ